MAAEVLLMGGDERNVHLAEMLAERKDIVLRTYGLLNRETRGIAPETLISWADMVIFPIPAHKKGVIPTSCTTTMPEYRLLAALELMKVGSLAVGGFLEEPPKVPGIDVLNLLSCEEFLRDNAQATAEGAVLIALGGQKRTLRQTKCMIVGFGRIGRELCTILRGFGSDVTVAVRRRELFPEIESQGAKPIMMEQLARWMGAMDVIFNTVDTLVLDQTLLQLLSKKSRVLELASEPYGVDFAAAHLLGVDAKVYLGIPGKMFPETAGALIYKQVIGQLKKRGMLDEA